MGTPLSVAVTGDIVYLPSHLHVHSPPYAVSKGPEHLYDGVVPSQLSLVCRHHHWCVVGSRCMGDDSTVATIQCFDCCPYILWSWSVPMPLPKQGGYSAVVELTKAPVAKEGCGLSHVHQEAMEPMDGSLEHINQAFAYISPHWQLAMCAQVAPHVRSMLVLSSSRSVIEEGGVSHPTVAPRLWAAKRILLPRLWISSWSWRCRSWLGDRSERPSGSCGVRNAGGPLGRSFNREYSRQGGADHTPPKKPFQAAWRILSKLSSSKMSKPSSISNGEMVSICNNVHAWKMGAFLPEKKVQEISAHSVYCKRSWRRRDWMWYAASLGAHHIWMELESRDAVLVKSCWSVGGRHVLCHMVCPAPWLRTCANICTFCLCNCHVGSADITVS